MLLMTNMDLQRATTTGIVISGFGLSAFLFSTVAHVIYPGNTSEFLLVLAIGTSLPMVLGLFLIRPIPFAQQKSTHIERGGIRESFRDESLSRAEPEVDSSTRLLASGPEVEIEGEEDILPTPVEPPSRGSVASDYVVPLIDESLALSPRNPSRQRSRSAFSRRSVRTSDTEKTIDGMPNVSGTGLLVNKDFWLLFSITSLCELSCRIYLLPFQMLTFVAVSGTGLMCMCSGNCYYIKY